MTLVQRLTKTADIAGACDADDIAALLREAAEALAGRDYLTQLWRNSYIRQATSIIGEQRCVGYEEARMYAEEDSNKMEETFIAEMEKRGTTITTPSRAGGGEVGDIDRCRQWFDSVQDVNPKYLEQADYELAARLYLQLGMRIPSSIGSKLDAALDALHGAGARGGKG